MHVPATTFVITHSPSRFNHRGGVCVLSARGPVGLFSVLLLSIFATALTALTEAGLIALASGVNMERVLALNFSLELGVRPAWMVAVPGALLTCAGVVPRYHAIVGLKPHGVPASAPKSQRR